MNDFNGSSFLLFSIAKSEIEDTSGKPKGHQQDNMTNHLILLMQDIT
jgi:hypothetical protein